jgi:DHA2 family multidrug resistance protein
MMGNLGATLDEISWVSTGYIIANVIVIPMSGWLSAYFGRKRISPARFSSSSRRRSSAARRRRSADSYSGASCRARRRRVALDGAGDAVRGVPAARSRIGQAMFGVGVMVGPTLGPTLGGWIVDNYNWPWIFYINVPLGIIAAIMVMTYIHDAEHQERAEKIDVLGFVLLATCVGSLQFMLEKGERYDWFDSRLVTGLLITSVVSFLLLIWRELTTDEPIINFRVLKSRQLAAGVSIAAGLGLALFGSVFVLPIFLQSLHGLTANQTGLVILPGAIASAVTMAVVGKNANRLDARATVTVGAFMFFASMWLMSRMTLASGPEETFWPLILRGVGLGLIFVPLTGATMAELRVTELAQGTGHVQPDAPARRLARHRRHGDVVDAIHVGEESSPDRASHDDGPDVARPSELDHERPARARHEPGDGEAAGVDAARQAGPGPGERACVLADLHSERDHSCGNVAAAVLVQDGEE